MNRIVLALIIGILLSSIGCSSSPVTPERNTAILVPEKMPFQLAMAFAYPEIGDPLIIPTNVPTNTLIPQDKFPEFASYALAAFNIYFEPSDWDDWLVNTDNGERTLTYEPSDWDDWLTYEPSDWDDWLVNAGSTIPRIAQYHNPDVIMWIAQVGTCIDPNNLYEPSDWDDWLITYEPSDWDDWLASHSIDDIVALAH